MVENVSRVIKNDICFKNFVCCCNMADNKIKLFTEDLQYWFIYEEQYTEKINDKL